MDINQRTSAYELGVRASYLLLNGNWRSEKLGEFQFFRTLLHFGVAREKKKKFKKKKIKKKSI